MITHYLDDINDALSSYEWIHFIETIRCDLEETDLKRILFYRFRVHLSDGGQLEIVERLVESREVQSAAARAKELRDTPERPPVTVSEGQCRTCSLAPVCLPEKERFVHMGKTKPQRLFPPEDDRRVIHVVEQGCSIRKNGDQLIVYFPDGNKKPLPGMAIALGSTWKYSDLYSKHSLLCGQ
jgi:hypothetical protein